MAIADGRQSPTCIQLNCSCEPVTMLLRLAAVVGFAAVAFSAPPPATGLTTAFQVHHLSATEAAKSESVTLRGVVTQYIPEWSGFSLQDSTDAVYVSASSADAPPLRVGQVVLVEGRTSAGSFAPSVIASRVRVLGEAPLPPPEPATWQKLSSGACDNEYVQIEGVVRTAGAVAPPAWGWRALALSVDIGGNVIWAYLRGAENLAQSRLVDAKVRLAGVCLAFANSRRQFQRNVLLIPRADDIQVLEPGPANPFDAPIRPIDRLFGFAPSALAVHRVKVQGVVTFYSAARLFVQDGDNGLEIRAPSAAPLHRGDRIEAVGFAAPGVYSAVLEDAVVRVLSQAAEPAPRDIRADGVLVRTTGNVPAAPDALLVRIEATVLDGTRSAREETLILQDGHTTFTARLPVLPASHDLKFPEPGARLAVTGVCAVQVDDRGLPRSFDILMRTPADVRVLAGAPWLTRAYATRAAGGLLAILLASVVWVGLLRRRVRVQTRTIIAHLEREAVIEQQCRELVEHASDMVYTRDPQGNLLRVNHGTEQLTGYTRAELLGMNVIDLIVPEQREVARQQLDRQPEGDLDSSEWQFLTKDGREIIVEIKRRFIVEDGHVARIECIGRDVTARKHVLSDNQERFRTLADNIPQLAWMADESGSIFWYNRRWFDYTGTSLEEARGSGWQNVHHPDHLGRVLHTLQHSVDAGEPWEDAHPLRGKDGQYRWFLSRAVPIRDQMGRVVRWFGTHTDITEQKHTETELQRSNEDLQQFAYVASHDLQEPLRNICIYSEKLARSYSDGDLTPERRQYIDFVSTGARRMDSLIRDLLAYSRTVAPAMPQRKHVSMSSVFEDALTNLSGSIAESGASVTSDPLPEVVGNPPQLVQVLQNLIGNSIKYRRPDVAPRVHVSADRSIEGWVFSVSDNGQGFGPEYAEKVFGIFKRLHGSDVPGTGIGLAICKTIVERHGGRIWAESHPGEGSVFHFTIPYAS